MTDNRIAQRFRVLKAATIEFGGSAIDCTVRNLSSVGAALDVASPVGIPEDFILVMPGSGTRQMSHIVWRKEKRIGVVFK
jgi:hypothetical protein